MKIISLNIELNRHHDLVLPFLKKEKADVVCLQELLEEDFEMYKKELEMDGVHRLTNYINDKVHIESRGKKEGIAIFSKKIQNSGYIFHVWDPDKVEMSFDEYLIATNSIKPKALLWADIRDDKGDVFRIITSHLTITYEGEVTPFQLEANQIFINQAKSLGEFIFCGDTNAPRGREAFDTIAREFKDNIPLKYVNSLDKELHRKEDDVDLMVDCLFTTPAYEASNVELRGGLSDHMAVVAEVNKNIN